MLDQYNHFIALVDNPTNTPTYKRTRQTLEEIRNIASDVDNSQDWKI